MEYTILYTRSCNKFDGIYSEYYWIYTGLLICKYFICKYTLQITEN